MDEKNHFKQYMSVRNSITLLVQQYVGIRSTEKRKKHLMRRKKNQNHMKRKRKMLIPIKCKGFIYAAANRFGNILRCMTEITII